MRWLSKALLVLLCVLGAPSAVGQGMFRGARVIPEQCRGLTDQALGDCIRQARQQPQAQPQQPAQPAPTQQTQQQPAPQPQPQSQTPSQPQRPWRDIFGRAPNQQQQPTAQSPAQSQTQTTSASNTCPEGLGAWRGPYPTAGCINHAYCVPWDRDPVGRIHSGIDIQANEGTDVVAATGGTAMVVPLTNQDGYAVVIRDGARTARAYLHLQANTVANGATVRAGQWIGTTNGLSHLHYNMCSWANEPTRADLIVCSRGALGVNQPYNNAGDDPLFRDGPFVDPRDGQRCARQSSAPAAQPTAPLSVIGFEQDIPVSSAPYTHDFRISGAALNAVTEIRWTWTTPSGVTQGSTWRRGDQNWSRYASAGDGRSAVVRPVLIAANDQAGRYRWQVEFAAGSQRQTRAFTVHYALPNAPAVPRSDSTTSSQPARPPAVPGNPSPGSTSSPGQTLSSTSVNLNWNSVAGAAEYDLGVRDSQSGELIVDRRVTGASYTANLRAGRQYRWNVRACNSAGCSSFTAPLNFQTPGGASSAPSSQVSIPGVPRSPSPGAASSPGPTVSTSVRLSWGSVSGATEYDFGIRDLTTNQLVEDTQVRGTSFTANLRPGRQYRWNVRACNAAGCSSFTSALYFQTAR